MPQARSESGAVGSRRWAASSARGWARGTMRVPRGSASFAGGDHVPTGSSRWRPSYGAAAGRGSVSWNRETRAGVSRRSVRWAIPCRSSAATATSAHPRWHRPAAPGQLHLRRGRHAVPQRHAPDLRPVQVETKVRPAGGGRGRAVVRVGRELEGPGLLGGREGEVERGGRRSRGVLVQAAHPDAPRRPVLADGVQRGCEDVPGGDHPRAVVLPAVRLHEHREPVPQSPVAVREAWRVDGAGEARGRIVVAQERGVEVERLVPGCAELVVDLLLEHAGHRLHRRGTLEQRRDQQRDVGLEVRAVGDVEIEEDEGVPGLEHRQQRPHLGRVRLHPVAVQVQVLRVGAPPLLAGPVLVGAVVGRGVLVPVDVEDGDEDEGELSEHAGQRGALEQLAEQLEPGVLAVDLSGVDAGEREHHRPATTPGLLRGERAVVARGQDPEGPSLSTLAEALRADPPAEPADEGAGEGVDLPRRAGLGVAGPLGVGLEGRRSGAHRGPVWTRSQPSGSTGCSAPSCWRSQRLRSSPPPNPVRCPLVPITR